MKLKKPTTFVKPKKKQKNIFTNMAISTPTPKDSKEAQLILFKEDITWHTGAKFVQNMNRKYLVLTKGRYRTSFGYQDTKLHSAITVEKLKEMIQ